MLWVKLFHIVMVISWMAGIFYLPRIFVHIAEALQQQEDIKRLLIMAHKLFFFMIPMSSLTILTGTILWLYYNISGEWLYLKISLVVCLLIYYIACGYLLNRIKKKKMFSSFFYRIFNEISIVILIAIIYSVVFKPSFSY